MHQNSLPPPKQRQIAGCALLPLDAVQGLPLCVRLVWCWQAHIWWQLEPEVSFVVDVELATNQPASEHMTAGAPVRSDEVEVVAGDVQTLRVVGKPEADEATRDVVKLKGGLVLD